LTHDIFGQSFDNVLFNERQRGIQQDMAKIKDEVQLQKQQFQQEENITFNTLVGLGILVEKESGLYEVPARFEAMVKHSQDNAFPIASFYGFGELNTNHYKAYQELMDSINDDNILALAVAKQTKKDFVATGKNDFDQFREMYNQAFTDTANYCPLTYKLYKAIGSVGRAIYGSGGTFFTDDAAAPILYGEQLQIVQQGMTDIMNGQEYKELFEFVQV
jgi:hypothetical protein